MRGEAGEQPAVLVVGGKEVGAHELDDAGAALQLERLVELADAPFEHRADGVLAAGAAQRERLAQILADQLALLEAGQLEDPLADGQDAALRGRTRACPRSGAG